MSYIGTPPFGNTVRTSTSKTADGVANAFYPDGGYVVGYLDVYYNGVKLTPVTDYTADDGVQVSLATTPANNSTIEMVAYWAVSFTDTITNAGGTMQGTLVTRDVIPSANNTYDLGNTSHRFANLYLSGNTIILGDAVISANASHVNFILSNGSPLSVNAVIVDANSTVSGVLKVVDSTSNTGTLVAAAANSVKTAFDLATTANSGLATAYSNAVGQATTLAGTAYSNAVSVAAADATSKAATAYSNATSYADTVAGTAYTNAVSQATSLAGTAYSNAVTQATTLAGTAYSNAVTQATTLAGTAYSNAVATAAADATSKAATAYSNAVSVAAADATSKAATAYSNAVATIQAGSTFTGPVFMQANLTANNVRLNGSMQIDGNLTVSGTSVTLNVASLSVGDNMIYLNSNSTVSNPDLGFAGNYNDGTYRHAGLFRDATDGRWKFFHEYLPEPDASAYIDTANASFALANLQAHTFIGNLSGDATSVGGNTALTLRTYSDTVAATAYSNATTFAANASNISGGTLATARGGTGLGSFTSTSLLYASNTTALTTSGNLTFSGTVLSVTGSLSTGSLSLSAATGGGNYIVDGAYGRIGTMNSTGSPYIGYAVRSKLGTEGGGANELVSTTSIGLGRAAVMVGSASGGTSGLITFHTGPGEAGVADGGTLTNFAERMRIASDGKVGIGVQAPDVFGVHAERGGSDSVYFKASSTAGYALVSGIAPALGYGIVGTTTNHALHLFSNNASRVIIAANGNVGIGNSSPSQLLTIAGRFHSDLNNNYYGAWGEGNTATNGQSFFAVGEWYSASAYFQKREGQSYAHIYTHNSSHNLILQGGSGDNGANTTSKGNVGIGTTSPGSTLSVRGSTNLGDSHSNALTATHRTRISGFALRYDASTRYGSYGQLIFNADTSWTSAARRYLITNGLDASKFAIVRSADADTDPSLGDGGAISSGTADFVITGGGNVGIGTTGPTYKLDVVDSSSSVARFYTSGSYIRPVIQTAGTSGNPETSLHFTQAVSGGGGRDYYMGIYSPTTGRQRFYFDNRTSLPTDFEVNGSAIMTLAANGNVGVGNTTPSSKLVVSGDMVSFSNGASIAFHAGSRITSPYTSISETTSGAMSVFGHNASASRSVANQITAQNNSYHSHFIRMYYDQGIAFHTSSGTRTAGDILYDFGTPGNVVAGTAERMRIDPSGNIGVGTTSPNARLNIIADNVASVFALRTRPSGTNHCYVHFDKATSADGGILLSRDGNYKWQLVNLDTDALRFYNYSTSGSSFEIAANGHVGIGITSPTSVLTAVGTIESRGSAADTNYAAFLTGRYDSSHALQLGVKINSGTEAEVLGVYADGGGGNPRTVINPSVGWNVGIGTTSPRVRFSIDVGSQASVFETINIHNQNQSGNTGTSITFSGYGATTTYPSWRYAGIKGTYDITSTGLNSGGWGGRLSFFVNRGSGQADFEDVMTITGGGRVGIGTTSMYDRVTIQGGATGGVSGGLYVLGTTTDGNWGGGIALASYIGTVYGSLYASTNGLYAIGGTSGGVVLSPGATSWASASDTRLKNIVEPITDPLKRVMGLEPFIFSWKSDNSGKRRVGLSAQSVEQVLPESVTTTRNSVDLTDQNEYLAVQYTDIISLLVAAFQEQQVTIQQLTARVAALENPTIRG